MKSEPTNVAQKSSDGWIWYDHLGKDFGPWETKDKAEVLGKIRSKCEDKLIRLSEQNSR